MNVQKGKPLNQHILQPGHYPNQQPVSSTPFNHNFDGDASQKYPFGASYVGGTGVPVAGSVPARLPLATPLSGPNPPIATPPTGPNTVGGMPQGPPPGSFVAHGIDLSKQTPPLHQPSHQSAHHPLPPGGLAVSQQIPMANAGHGPMQGRPTQGNNQFANRYPMRGPGNLARPSMPGTAINPNHPPNTPSMPYPNASPGLNQQVLFVIGDGFNGQPYIPYIPPYYPPGGTMPPAGVTFNPPRAAQQQYGYRPAAPFQYPIQSSPAVYYPQQPQQPPQQPQQQPQQQQQQQQQPQQPQTAVPVVPASAAVPQQPRDSGTQRRQRSSALRIVDPNTNRDVLTGEEVPPTAATPPISASTTEETASPAATPAPALTTAVPTANTANTASSSAVAPTVEEPQILVVTVDPVEPVVEKVADPAPAPEVKSDPQVVTVAVEAPTAIIPAVEEVETLAPAPAVTIASASAPAPSVAVVDEVKATPAPIAVDRPVSTTSEKEASASNARENGLPSDLPSSSETQSSASPTPVSTPTSPETGDGRGTQKRKPGRKNSRPGTIPTRLDAEEASVVATVPSSTAEQKSRDPSSEKESSVNAIVVESTIEVDVKENITAQQLSAVLTVEDQSSVATSETAEPAAVVTNGDPQLSLTAPSTMTPESETTPPSAVSDDGEAQIRSNPSGLQYKEDQWSPHNPEGKKAYDRTFLLMLQKNPACQRKPEGLPNLEVVRDKSVTSKRLDFTPPFLKVATPGKAIGGPRTRSQQGSQRGGGDQQGPGMGQPSVRKEIRLQTSIARMERVEDPNVWKPKHAVKSKEDDPDKLKTDELLKTVRGILNKLTPSKFEKLLAKIQSLNIDTEDRLSGVIKLFFEKAVDEPIFSSTYARMCHALSNKEVASSANPSETTNFRKLLLNRCQREFEKDSASLSEVENKKKEVEAAEADKRKELEEILDDLVAKNRRRSLGNIRFIGELFKLRILSVKIMHQCIIRLLKDDDEESLECLCRLLSTIGKELETPVQPTGPRSSVSQNRDTMNNYFSQLEAIVRQRKTSNRIRFMIQDVMDLRKNQWKPRREDNNPKTIEQIHKDAERERSEQEQELLNAPSFPGSMGSMGSSSRDRPGDRRDRDDRNRKTSRGVGEDGWTVSGSRSNPKVDMKQLRIPRLAQAGDADQQGAVMLGPAGRGMGHSWGRGASGGMSTSISTESSNVGTGGGRSNRYQLLEDDSGTHGNVPDKAPFGGRSSLGGPPSRSHQEYRPVSGATKSAFFPPKDSERERCLDAVRSQNAGPLGRSRSQQSSRESSVTRPVKETAQSQSVPREPVREPLLGKPGLKDDEIERKVGSLLGEYFSNEIMEDVVLDLKESLHSSNVSKFVNFCVMHVLEHDRTQRRGTGSIFKEMIKRRFFSTDDILEGFSEVLVSAEDFLVDIPKLWEYLAEMIDPLFSDGVVPLTFLRPLSSSVKTSLVANFVAAIIKELVKTQGGEAAVGRMWSTTNLQLGSLLPEVDPVAFGEQQKIRFLLDFESASTPPGADKSASSSSGSGSTHTNYPDFQSKLERYLKGASRSTEEVCMWIQQNTNGDINPSFIRALVTAVTESCIDGIGTDSKLNATALKNLSEVLRKYVDNAADLELQSLFAVQALVTHRQHPKGLIQGIFEMLYDSNVVSEDGFETWVNTDDPSEREGKAVALKSLTSFLTWLKEADPESDQDAEAP